MTLRRRVQDECGRRGQQAVVAGCIDLLDGQPVDDALILALGGRPAEYVLAGAEGGRSGYWPRVWAARGLLHAWAERATAAILRASTDESWRVREMAAKVIARHRVSAARLEDALTSVTALHDDPVPRVRSAATRAAATLIDPITALSGSSPPFVTENPHFSWSGDGDRRCG